MGQAGVNYYEHHLGDFMRDTAHLTMVEECAYRRLLDAYYTRERALPGDLRECCKLARATAKPERDAVAYVLREFFELREDGYHQGRADKEIARFLESEPEREAKRENERERQRRTRERRKQLFDLLRSHGIVPAFDSTMSELNALLSRVTSQQDHAGVTRDDTATQTPLPTSHTPDINTQSLSATECASGPTPGASVCLALREVGIAAVNPSHPTLLALLEAGATVQEFVGAVDAAKGKADPFAYLLGVVKGRRIEAAKVAQMAHRGALPTTETPRQRAARERMEQIAPTAAAKRPGAQTAEIIDVTARRLG